MKKSPIQKLFYVIGLMALCVVLSSCEEPTKAIGNASIKPHLLQISHGATFNFQGDNCDREVQGQFNFVDETVEKKVHLSGEVTESDECDFFTCAHYCFEDEIFLTATYISHNHDYPGKGELTACLRDGRRGITTATQQGYVHSFFVNITSGPYAGYVVEGSVEGKFAQSPCQLTT